MSNFALSARFCLVTLLVMGTFLAHPTSANATTNCHPLQILMFRGTEGENAGPNDNDNDDEIRTYSVPYNPVNPQPLTTNGWEGMGTFERFLTGYIDTLPWYIRGADEIPVIGIDDSGYPANTSPNGETNPFEGMMNSALMGVDYALEIMEDIQDSEDPSCPTPKFMAVGYSQGAVAAHILTIQSSEVVAAYTIGDLWQMSHTGMGISGPTSTGNGGTGMLRSFASTANADYFDSFYDWVPLYTQSRRVLCHTGDPYCDYNYLFGPPSILPWFDDEHENYFTAYSQTVGGVTYVENTAELSTFHWTMIYPWLSTLDSSARMYTSEVEVRATPTVRGSTQIISIRNSDGVLFEVDADNDSRYEFVSRSNYLTLPAERGVSEVIKVRVTGPNGVEIYKVQQDISDSYFVVPKLGEQTKDSEISLSKNLLSVRGPKVRDGETYGVRIVDSQSTDLWESEPILVSEITNSPKLTVDLSELASGDYKVVVLTSKLRYQSFDLSIR